MEKKKRYLLNCEVCDARKMHENLFDPYDEVVINADVLLVAELFCVNTLRFHFFLAPGGLVRFVAHFQPSLKSLFLIQLPTIIYMAKRCFTIKIRNSSRQNAEKYCPEVEKSAPAEYITKEFCLAIITHKWRYTAILE